MKPLRILIADDHALIREGLRRLLSSRPDWEVCAEAGDGREAVEKVKALKPAVAILDFSMPKLNGIEATREIRAATPKTEVLVLTMHQDAHLVQEVFAAGALGCVLKSDSNEMLIQAVETVARQDRFFSASIAGLVLERFAKPQVISPISATAAADVTPREREVLQLITEGKTSKEIASTLRLSVKTVDAHRANLMRKLNLHSVADLVMWAVRHNLARR
jgi:DNA-binding NarL/FixJ family response regulator